MTENVETHQHSPIDPDWFLESLETQYELDLDLAQTALAESGAEIDLNNLYLDPTQYQGWKNVTDGEAANLEDPSDFYRHIAFSSRIILSEVSRLGGLDPMTEVFNKVAFGRELNKLINAVNFENGIPERRASDTKDKKSKRVAVFMIDLDGFKATNDFIGHPAGDAVLIKVAKLLQENVRGDAVVGRLGGDEFSLAVPLKDDEEAEIVKARIEAIFQKRFLAFQFKGNTTDAGKTLSEIAEKGFAYKEVESGTREVQIPVRASVGMIVADQDDDAQLALAKADKFMFAQKKVHHDADPSLKR